MVSTFSGMVIVVSPAQLMNALPSISVTVDGRDRASTPSLTRPVPRDVTVYVFLRM